MLKLADKCLTLFSLNVIAQPALFVRNEGSKVRILMNNVLRLYSRIEFFFLLKMKQSFLENSLHIYLKIILLFLYVIYISANLRISQQI